MAIGRITGPLLKSNLVRKDIVEPSRANLAFETNLLYLDVLNGRVGIKTTTPSHDLQVVGTTRTTNIEVVTQADLASFTLLNDTISSTSSTINLLPAGGSPVVYQGTIVTGDLRLSTNLIETTGTNTDLQITTTGTGKVLIGTVSNNTDVLITGNLHTTGNITADGSITIGDVNTDNIVFNADIASNIIPDQNNTYDLGTDPGDLANSNPLATGQAWRTTYSHSILTTDIYTDQLIVNNIDLRLPQGQTYYVAVNGSDAYSGTHENDPYATLKHALSVANAGDTIFLYSGTYREVFPLTVPAGVTIRGAGIRAVTIKPSLSTIDKDAFLLNGETTIEDLSVSGFRYNSSNNTGYAFRFANNITVTTRSPYIRNTTVITRGTPTVLSVSSFKTQNNASITRIKNIIVDLILNNTITPSSGNTTPQVKHVGSASDNTTGTALQGLLDNIIYVINNTPYASALPAVTPSGNPSTSAVKLNAASLIQDNYAFLKAEMVAYLNVTYPNFWILYNQAKAERDLGYILDALRFDVVHGGNERSVETGIAYWQNTTSDPYGFDINDAGKGVLADGSVANASSKEASLLFHSVTFITPNQETVTATNGVRIEWLNSFTYFAEKGFYAYSGSTGFAGAGLTRLRIDTKTGSWSVGDTVTYYDTNGTTVLASGTIASISGNYINLSGKSLGFQTITDRSPKLTFANGDAKLSTSQKKFGTASLALDGTGDFVVVPSQPDFAFDSQDFCIEAWIYNTGGQSAVQTIFDFRTTSPQVVPIINIQSGGAVNYVVNGVAVIASNPTTIALNTWTHIAVSKSGTSTKLFINGTQAGSTYIDNFNYIQGPLTLGARYDGTLGFNGYIDDVRISKGVPRYTSNFVAPVVALTGDLSTVLLLHFNGSNNSTVFLDDGVTLQDIRVTRGGPVIGQTTLINFADYSDFGAEVRAIGSANIYGTYGFYGDGDGVIAYLISQNFAYVGAGKLSTNDPNDRIAANEVTKLNRAKIYYTSVDNEGNFKVGDAFYVNQKTGEVLFNNQSLTINAPEGVIFTDGVHTTTILPTNIDTGNIRISGNTISSLTGDVNVTAASGAINLKNNTFITGNLDVTGNITLGGNIQIGDQSSDFVNFIGTVNSDLIPTTTATYNLGQNTTPLRWKNVYLNRAEIDGLTIDNNIIRTTIGNDDLQLIANGNGRIYIPSNNVQLDQSLTVTQNLTVTTGTTYLKNVGVTGTITQVGDINQTGNFVTSGNTQVTGNITGTGYLQLPAITINGNTIQTTTTNTDLVLNANGNGNVILEGIKVQDNNIQSTVTNSNIILTPQGTGNVQINSTQSLIIPVGTTAERPASPTNGMIRYNTTTSRYEGRSGSYWVKLGGVEDISGNTRILPEATPGANDNTIYFYANNTLTVTIDSTKLFAERFQTTNLDIHDNVITPITADTDLNFTTTGTGGVKIGNLRYRNNTITNVAVNGITEFVQTGNGYVKVSGTNGIVIPAGDSQNDRPALKETGMMRFNTELQIVEIWNGLSWTSVAGTTSGVTVNEATDVGIQTVLILG